MVKEREDRERERERQREREEREMRGKIGDTVRDTDKDGEIYQEKVRDTAKHLQKW